jgi:uracil-DNA glycosylase family 4
MKILESLKQINEEKEKCTKCSLHENSKIRCHGYFYPSKQSVNTKIVFIARNPGNFKDQEIASEDVAPFGLQKDPNILKYSEVYFRKLITELHFTEFHITNIVKCDSKNNVPTKEQQYQCMHFLAKELNIIKPEQIYCLGREAANLFGLNFGQFVYNTMWNKKVFVGAVYHPAYIYRNPGMYEKWKKQVNEFQTHSFFKDS